VRLVGLGLRTDRYELTMLEAALADGTAAAPCTFEVFARRLPDGRRFGIVGGTGRALAAITGFGFDTDELDWLTGAGIISDRLAGHLADYTFSGRVDGYPEGELYFPGSPVLTVTATFAEAVVLETAVLSILNHDSAIASAAARMVLAADGRPLIEMGSRRTHEEAAVAAARAAWLAGFTGTSNLAAGRIWHIPTLGTSAHAFTLLHDSEQAAFRAQVDVFGAGTTLLVDTYDIAAGVETAVGVAGPALGAVRIDSGDLAVLARRTRAQLDAAGAFETRILLSGDLDEYAIAGLGAAPVDSFGVGTSVVTGSGSPTAGFVYKLVEVDGRPVAKNSEGKASRGGRKWAVRRHRRSGTATEEVLGTGPAPEAGPGDRRIDVPLLADGAVLPGGDDLPAARDRVRTGLITLPWDGVKLSRGEPAIPTTLVGDHGRPS
jgi:nicotinate phosphoribosyltransferase